MEVSNSKEEAPHMAIKDKLKEDPIKDCTICSSTGLRIVEKIALILCWDIY